MLPAARTQPNGFPPLAHRSSLLRRPDPRGNAQTRDASNDRGSTLTDGATSETRFATDRLGGGVFVGRERERAELGAALDEAERGRGSLFLLSGEPGIGKTRLADRLCGIAARRGARVFWGRAWEGEGAPAYWPWVQVIRALAEASTPAELAEAMGASAAHLVQIVPELRDQLPNVPPATTSPDSEHARFYLFDATARFLKKAAQSRPLVLVLDDLHWADKSSLLLLEHLAQELRDARMLVIGTYREAEARQAGPLADVVAQLARVSQPLPLRGLAETEVDAFMETIGRTKPDAQLVSAVHRATGGNPFFVDEIVRLLLAEGAPASGRIPIPDSVRAVIRRRLAFLPEGTRQPLAIGAVAGRELDLTLLEHACAQPASTIAEKLAPAVTAGLVTRLSGAVGRYSFAHALIRETLYEDLGPAERQQFHRAIGTALEAVRAADLEPHLAELAHHFLEVAVAGDAEKAIDYSIRAGRRAAGMHGYEEAVGHFEQALDVLGRMAPDEARRCELLVSLGEAQGRAGEFEAAKDPLVRGADLARKLGLAEPLARAALRFGHPLPGIPFSEPTHVRLLEDALAALEGVESLLRVRVTSRLAAELLFSKPERAVVLANEALAVARRVGAPAALAAAQTVRCVMAFYGGRYDELREALFEVERLAAESGDCELTLLPPRWRIVCDVACGDVSSADRNLAAFAQAAEEFRQRWHTAYTPAYRAMRAMMQGRFAEAETLIDEGSAIGSRARGSNARLITSLQKFMLLREQGRFAELAKGFERGVLIYDGTAIEPAYRVTLHRELGREAEAREEFERLAASDFASMPFDPNRLVALGWLSEVCSSLGDASRAAVLYDLLLPRDGEIVIVGPAFYCLHTVSHHLGLLAATMSHFADAERHFEHALATSARIGARPWIPRTQFHYAEMLLRRGEAGDREKAVRLLEQSIATASELGMKSLLERAQSLRAGQLEPERAFQPGTSRQDTVTLMFSDMSGFTEMTEKLGDRQALEVVEAHNAIVRNKLQAHEGRELELQGDGFLLAFDAAIAAVRCAVAVQRAFAAYSAEHPAQPIGVKIGIHSGEPLPQGDRYFGKAVILVTRIAGQAKPGEILVSSVVRDLGESDHDLRFDEGRDVELKGITGRRRIYRVHWAEGEDAPRPREAPEATPVESSVFRREGDYWTVTHEGRSFRLKDTKGLRYLAELFFYPDLGFRAIDLAAADLESPMTGDGSQTLEGVSASSELGHAGPLLDVQAKANYRLRLDDLTAELDEAERFNDSGRVSRAREEIDFLTDELARATGLGGRDRKAGSAAERARSNVTIAIKAALKRISENDTALGRHLALTIKTGNVCTYTPDPRSPIVWSR